MRLMGRIATGSFLIVLLVGCSLVIYSTWLDHKAAKIIRLSGELLERDALPTLGDLREQFRGELQQSTPCGAAGCQYDITLSNHVLAQLHLAPFTALRSTFWVRYGLLEENSLEVWTMTN